MIQNLRVTPCDPRCPTIYEVPVESGNIVAKVFGSCTTGEASKEECLANAYLMAASPDLLAACEAVLASPRVGDCPSPEAVEIVRAAIAKAKGPTP